VDNNGAACCESGFGGALWLEQLMSGRFLPVFSLGILPSTWTIPRQVYDRTGGFCEAFKGPGGFEDHWMLLRLRELGDFVYVPEKLTLYRAPESGKSADKYAPGLPVFISLARERYCAQGKALIRNARNKQCKSLLSKVAYQMNKGDRLGAIRTLIRIATIRPAFFFGSDFRSRLVLPHNLKRVRDLTAVLGRAHD
jgi:hypothetical protein